MYKLNQGIMDNLNKKITKMIADTLGLTEEEVPNWITIGWREDDDGISRYFVSGNTEDTVLKDLGPILLDMCDQLAGMGHLPKIKLQRDPKDPSRFLESGECHCGTGGCGSGKCKGKDFEIKNPWSDVDKKDWN